MNIKQLRRYIDSRIRIALKSRRHKDDGASDCLATIKSFKNTLAGYGFKDGSLVFSALKDLFVAVSRLVGRGADNDTLGEVKFCYLKLKQAVAKILNPDIRKAADEHIRIIRFYLKPYYSIKNPSVTQYVAWSDI